MCNVCLYNGFHRSFSAINAALALWVQNLMSSVVPPCILVYMKSSRSLTVLLSICICSCTLGLILIVLVFFLIYLQTYFFLPILGSLILLVFGCVYCNLQAITVLLYQDLQACCWNSILFQCFGFPQFLMIQSNAIKNRNPDTLQPFFTPLIILNKSEIILLCCANILTLFHNFCITLNIVENSMCF